MLLGLNTSGSGELTSSSGMAERPREHDRRFHGGEGGQFEAKL